MRIEDSSVWQLSVAEGRGCFLDGRGGVEGVGDSLIYTN